MLKGSAELVGARSGLASAPYAVQSVDYLLGLHADDKSAKAFCVAIAPAMEMALADASVLIEGHLDKLAACASGLVEHFWALARLLLADF